MDDPRGEPPIMMARAALLLASEPAAKVNGRVTYSQQILKEFGWIENGGGRGVDSPGSGYSQILTQLPGDTMMGIASLNPSYNASAAGVQLHRMG